MIRAYDLRLRREVALKEVLLPKANEEDCVRLLAEARAMAKLSHPNVVAVYDVEGMNEGTQARLVMEYVAGQSLSAWLRREPRAWPDVLEVYAAAGRGLAAAHCVGLLHRDFKPSNVLVAEPPLGEREVKVTDFGLARLGVDALIEISLDGTRCITEESLGAEGVTATGALLGTPRYMAPEQVKPITNTHGVPLPLTAAADQYAFWCVALAGTLRSTTAPSAPWSIRADRGQTRRCSAVAAGNGGASADRRCGAARPQRGSEGTLARHGRAPCSPRATCTPALVVGTCDRGVRRRGAHRRGDPGSSGAVHGRA